MVPQLDHKCRHTGEQCNSTRTRTEFEVRSLLEHRSCATSDSAFRNTDQGTAINSCHCQDCAGQVERHAASQRLSSNKKSRVAITPLSLLVRSRSPNACEKKKAAVLNAGNCHPSSRFLFFRHLNAEPNSRLCSDTPHVRTAAVSTLLPCCSFHC